jgi:hypothetical protein
MYVFKRTGSTGTTSKYWSVKFRGHDGRQILRTTRCENKQEAVKIGTKWERAARLPANGEFTQAASITFFNELLRATTAEELNVPRVEAYLDSWLESKRVLAKAKGTPHPLRACSEWLCRFSAGKTADGNAGKPYCLRD